MKKQDNVIIGIYKITNPKGRVYIGQSINIYNRWNYFYKRVDCKTQLKIYRSLKKYGPENHIFEVIEKCLVEELDEREIYWIKFYNSTKQGLNLKEGGKYGIHSQETKNKISKSKKGKSQNRNNKIVQYDMLGNFIKEWNNISEITYKLKIKYNSINNCCLGISKTAGKYIWKYKNDIHHITSITPHQNSKIVLQFKDDVFIKKWENALKAGKSLGKHPSAISSCCLGKGKTAYGYKWKYE